MTKTFTITNNVTPLGLYGYDYTKKELKTDDGGGFNIKGINLVNLSNKDDPNLWPNNRFWRVDVDENIVHRTATKNHFWFYGDWNQNDNDTFYYFIHYLNKEIPAIPVGTCWGGKDDFFYVLDFNNMTVKNVIEDERNKWKSLGYNNEDCIPENKKLVDKGIRKEERQNLLPNIGDIISENKLSLENKIKKLLEINISNELPSDWDKQLSKKSDSEKLKSQMESLRKAMDNVDNNLKEKLTTDGYKNLIQAIDQEVEDWKKDNWRNWKEKKLDKEENIQVEIENFLKTRDEEQEIKDLVQKLLHLKWELINKQKEIEGLKIKLSKDREGIKNDIYNEESSLYNKRKELEKEIKGNDTLVDALSKIAGKHFFGVEENNERVQQDILERILKLQENEVRFNADDSYKQEREGLIKKIVENSEGAVDENLKKELEELCRIKEKITKLELELWSIDRNVQIINQGIYARGNVNVEGGFKSVDNKVEVLTK